MALPWFRLYTEFASDPKIQILAFEDQRHFIMLLCLKGSGVLDTQSQSTEYRERLIAKALGLDLLTAAEAKRRLIEGQLIDDQWYPLKWDERQYVSDLSTPRVQAWRDKKKRNGDVTFPKRYETVKDQIQNRTEEKIADAAPVDNLCITSKSRSHESLKRLSSEKTKEVSERTKTLASKLRAMP